MTAWEPVIGLELHVQLRTASKMFCGCDASYGGATNRQICPVCCGLPGTLPMLNRRAVELAVRLGLAVGGEVHHDSVFARKNYFYPDLPKGYQISQFDRPLVTGGGIHVETEDRGRRFIRLVRIHLEEDAGKSTHGEHGSRVDLNRAGVPLCEIVSEPDIRSAAEAMAYMKAMRSIVRYLAVSDGNLEEGSLRCDVNISLREAGTEPFGRRTELKNINSFRFVGQAIGYEIERHSRILDGGGRIAQETRTWDSTRGESVFLRSKEDAHDYRYFPEPDLLPLRLSADFVEAARGTLVELPDARSLRYQREFSLPPYDANVLTADKAVADWFEAGASLLSARGHGGRVKALSNWTMTEVLRRLREDGRSIEDVPFGADRLVAMLDLLDDGTISGPIAKNVFDVMWTEGGEPAAIVDARGLRQVSDSGPIDDAIRAVLVESARELAEFRAGKVKLRGFFVGQTMKKLRGQGNPALVNARLDAILAEGS